MQKGGFYPEKSSLRQRNLQNSFLHRQCQLGVWENKPHDGCSSKRPRKLKKQNKKSIALTKWVTLCPLQRLYFSCHVASQPGILLSDNVGAVSWRLQVEGEKACGQGRKLVTRAVLRKREETEVKMISAEWMACNKNTGNSVWHKQDKEGRRRGGWRVT